MTYESRYAELMKQMESGLNDYIKEVAVATLKIGNGPLPKGLRATGTKPMVVGHRYYVIPVDPKERT